MPQQKSFFKCLAPEIYLALVTCSCLYCSPEIFKDPFKLFVRPLLPLQNLLNIILMLITLQEIIPQAKYPEALFLLRSTHALVEASLNSAFCKPFH